MHPLRQGVLIPALLLAGCAGMPMQPAPEAVKSPAPATAIPPPAMSAPAPATSSVPTAAAPTDAIATAPSSASTAPSAPAASVAKLQAVMGAIRAGLVSAPASANAQVVLTDAPLDQVCKVLELGVNGDHELVIRTDGSAAIRRLRDEINALPAQTPGG